MCGEMGFRKELWLDVEAWLRTEPWLMTEAWRDTDTEMGDGSLGESEVLPSSSAILSRCHAKVCCLLFLFKIVILGVL